MHRLKKVYIVYVIILLILLVQLVLVFNKLIDIHALSGNDFSFNSIYRSLIGFNNFKVILFSIISVIAIFYKSKLSWIVMLSYFYFLIWSIIAISFSDIKFEDIFDVEYVLTTVVLLIVPIVSIYILNILCTFKDIYGIERKRLMLYNLIAFIIGCGINLFVLISENSRYYKGF